MTDSICAIRPLSVMFKPAGLPMRGRKERYDGERPLELSPVLVIPEGVELVIRMLCALILLAFERFRDWGRASPDPDPDLAGRGTMVLLIGDFASSIIRSRSI